MEDSKKKGVVLTTCSFDGLQQKHGRVLKRYKITPSSPLAAIRNRSVSVLASYVHGNGAVTKAEREMVKKRRDDDIRRQLAYNATQGNAVQIRTLIKHTAFSVDTRIDGDVAGIGEENLTVRCHPPLPPVTVECHPAPHRMSV